MENKAETQLLSPKGTFPAAVAKVIDDCKVVINRGLSNGIRESQRMLIYRIDEEIKDPDTGESLGNLELVIGTGKVIFVQEKIAILESDNIVRTKPNEGLFAPTLYDQAVKNGLIEPTPRPFDHPQVGDRVKPI
jgi:hypothetical protein